ncbi:MAG: transporter [Alphaproteobacteria bacterium]|nr:transporter [Alphaproteobacteria bacterium]
MKKSLVLVALSTVLLSSTAMAAGFHLREQSAAAQGNAYAGATAGAENNAYAYYNVAGLTRIKGTQFSGGATYIAPKAEAKNVRSVATGERGADAQNVVHAAVSPYFTISHQVNDKLFIALAGNSPFGMITKYDQDWVGGDHGITSDLKTATFTPMAAYKATDKLSVGAGLQIQYVWAHLTNSSMLPTQSGSYIPVNHVAADGDALDFGYQLGAMYEFTPATRVGIGYRSEIKHKIKGDMNSSVPAQAEPYHTLLNGDISAKLNTPAMLSMGIYHDINERLAIMAEYQRVFWSSFHDLVYVSREGAYSGMEISRVHEHWRDTNFYAIGTSYMLDEQWKLRLGLAYDQSAVRVQHRTPRIPDSDRIWYSVGLGYKYNDNLSFDAGFTYIAAHDAHLDTRYTGNKGRHVTADYSNSVKVFSFGLTYNF